MVAGKKDALINVELMGGIGDTYQEQFKSRAKSSASPKVQDTISSIGAFDGVCGAAGKCLSFLISSDLFGPDGDGNAKVQLRLSLRNLPAEWMLDPSLSIRVYQSFG